ncbi:MAG: 5'-nucleotidase C-terminal domain-containing protein [Saprospiraceae bacterium]|jgi:2',3'-cyclic-nucleotide 2'-phosphodiesterase (5'-nucleotidase family)|nr:5'-nucleotidase C-terminal domain-containing protein [Saprospiraceae bacterium]
MMKTAYHAILASFILLSCQKYTFITETKTEYHRIQQGTMRVDTQINALILPYKVKVDSAMNEVVGYAETELIKGKPVSPLTNWMGDVLLQEATISTGDSIDAAILNYGGVRVTSMPAGAWTVGQVFELMPFDNVLYITRISGIQMRQLCNHIAGAGGWPVSSTLRFSLRYGKADDITVKGKPLDTLSLYTLALPDYIFQGGDNVQFLKQSSHQNTGLLIRNLLIQNVRRTQKQGQMIKADADPRIQ